MDRRTALSRIGLLVGGTLSLPVASAFLSGCGVPDADGYSLKILTSRQFDILGRLANFIIPDTDSPGATAAGVDRYIDTLLAEYYHRDEARSFTSTLDAMDMAFDVDEHSEQEIQKWLSDLDKRAFADDYSAPPSGSTNSLWLHRRIKEMVVAGYYSSEIGMTQELRTKPYGPARYDIPRSDVERTWSN